MWTTGTTFSLTAASIVPCDLVMQTFQHSCSASDLVLAVKHMHVMVS